MGSLAPEAQWRSSCIKANPWDEVAVKVLTPLLAAPIRAAKAECSLSTRKYLASKVPSAQYSESRSTIWVCGVMG
jgi:hypothetical protein